MESGKRSGVKPVVVVLLVIIAFGAGAAAGIFGFLQATGGSGEPSREASDVVDQLSLDDPTPTPATSGQISTEIAGINERLDVISTQIATNNIQAEVTAEPAAAAAPEETGNVLERALYRIDGENSEARFYIDEILAGNPFTVVGTTNQVAGDVIVNFTDPAASQIGEIAVNARTLRTDNDFRNQALRGQILQASSDEFEFITFSPTELSGLPSEPVSVGDTAEFQIIGDLTIRGETRSVTFDASVTVDSETQISGLATVQVLYPDFGITISAPPQVAGIEDEVIIELEFVAERVEEEGA